uniref:Uncharacterized protein n=1 Tax=Anguilla anguilla TaxID=7936 RepID=A0A0E9VQE2_ANGAN
MSVLYIPLEIMGVYLRQWDSYKKLWALSGF